MKTEKLSAVVSVIVTTYNRVTYLEQTLHSIQNQTYSNVEILVIDDGSEEKIALICKTLCDKYSKCTYYFKKNTGQPDSRNYGIKRSKGEYIAFCDDDDYWVLDKLEKQMNVLNIYPEYSLVNGCIEYVNEEGERIGNHKCHEGHNHGYVFDSFLSKNRSSSVTPLLKREIFDKIGYFDSNFTIAEDWEFWRRVSFYFKFYFIPETLALVRTHGENMSKRRTSDPLESFLLYRKLTISLIIWGKIRFKEEDFLKIYKTEWFTYRKILTNRCPGVLRKIRFISRVAYNNPMNLFHFCYLLIRFERII